eukprot:scaffold2224_cov261-Pinguiococcus_pyrenoidosus.AAC.17
MGAALQGVVFQPPHYVPARGMSIFWLPRRIVGRACLSFHVGDHAAVRGSVTIFRPLEVKGEIVDYEIPAYFVDNDAELTILFR